MLSLSVICCLIEIYYYQYENGSGKDWEIGKGMGVNHWEWEGMGLKKTFPLISTVQRVMLPGNAEVNIT